MRLVSGYYDSHYPFDNFEMVDSKAATMHPDELKKGDILLIWGGEDICPQLYNKPLSKHSGARALLSRRDATEWTLMNRAKNLGIPIIGVCRGSQMLCALAGGTLFQHTPDHPGGGIHKVMTIEGEELVTNSLHHQMMNPFAVKHEMLASIKGARQHYDVDNLIEVPEDPEFVYFPEVKGFAVQWHPEYMPPETPATHYIFKQMKARLDVL